MDVASSVSLNALFCSAVNLLLAIARLLLTILLSRITVKDFTDVLAGSGSGNFLVFVCTNSICYRADDVVYRACSLRQMALHAVSVGRSINQDRN